MKASNELKSSFKEIKKGLGDDWKKKILSTYPSMTPLEAYSVIDRLNRLALGRVAPTPSELEKFKSISP
ncbi:hypothetical protein BWI96_18875 [Siphonobacter sp. SORGH_AS_0500]|nr:hypothetical protein BWI96_18875 [Siphonobacter sp. SORGH_AS_0500]